MRQLYIVSPLACLTYYHMAWLTVGLRVRSFKRNIPRTEIRMHCIQKPHALPLSYKISALSLSTMLPLHQSTGVHHPTVSSVPKNIEVLLDGVRGQHPAIRVANQMPMGSQKLEPEGNRRSTSHVIPVTGILRHTASQLWI